MNGIRELATLVERFTGEDGFHSTALRHLTLIRASQPTEPFHGVHEPSVCFVVQGSKEVAVGDQTFFYDSTRYLVVSVDVPFVGQVVEATPETPYLCAKFELDRATVATMLETTAAQLTEPAGPCPAFSLTPATPALIDALTRFVGLLDTPGDIPVLGPLGEREILYRLLTGEQTSRLRDIAIADGRHQRINRAISRIKTGFREALRIDDLAAESNMSTSVFHEHFKAVTSLSPLQYQKQLRLQEARRLMMSEGADAASAGFAVGYESPSQFSREYRRLFGLPPARDVGRLRSTAQTAAAF